MPKGEKPSPSSFLPIEEVASTLKVQPSQILEWMQKDQLRGNDAGIKPYDLKKFQLDHQDEIRKAQAKALKDGQKTVDKKPVKGSGGFFSKLFGRGKGDEPIVADPVQLAQENRRLKDELSRARTETREDSATVQLEDKVKFLEGKLAKTSSLEAELAELRRQVSAGGAGQPDPQLEQQLEDTRRELARAQEAVRQSESLQAALRQAQEERDRLSAELSSAAGSGGEDASLLQEQLEQARLALHQAEDRLQSLMAEEEGQRARLQSSLSEREERISQLEGELHAARAGAGLTDSSAGAVQLDPVTDNALVDELLTLQEINLHRYARLRELHDQALAKLAQAPSSGDSLSEASYAKLQAEFETLRVKHQSILEARETNVPGHQEFVEQLAAARVTTTRLKQENAALKQRLSEADVEGWKQKVDELTQRLQQGNRASDANLELVETELRAVRKSLQSREAQVQKIAGRLQENERALKKALKESTRLTELLIERENRLRDLSTEYEQEYRDKIDNLDRQVSGLQWKLSLREERIASLESEVSELRKGVSR
jgi:chromosome segregation ATPase